MSTKKLPQSMIAIAASVEMKAATSEDGKPSGPPSFSSTFYNGGPVQIAGYDLPVVLDLAGVDQRKNLVANLDHDDKRRVGQFTATNDGKQLTAAGVANAKTTASEEVIGSAQQGWNWEASFEAQPKVIETVPKGRKVQINGQTQVGPLYVARESTLLGMGFVSHGADSETSVTIAASAVTTLEANVDKKLLAWVEELGIDPENISDEQLGTLKANYKGETKPRELEDFGNLRDEASRKQDITKLAIKASEGRFPTEIDAIERMTDNAIKAGTSPRDFELELLRESVPTGVIQTGNNGADPGLTNAVLEAAVCQAGGMPLDALEKNFSDQVLQASHERFRQGIGLNQLFFAGAESNSKKHNYERHVDRSTLEAAFRGSQMNADAGWSTVNIPTILSNTANKFLRIGWEFVENAWQAVSTIRPVSDFKEITTVSLTADATFKELGNGGTIQHGTAGEVTYANKADTYARMFGITRTDFINDDLGALTRLPQKIGRGGALKLNNIFWTEYMDNATFFSAGNNNLLTGTPDSLLSRDGLNAAESAFRNQTDPEGEPLGSMPEMLLVPASLVNTALELMGAQSLVGQGADAAPVPNRNIYAGRYRVVSSVYLENANYTGNSALAWYLLASPQDLPVIEIAALNGNVMPTVESADADFNVLGVQMRGYSDVGVRKQEFRGGVKSTGEA